MSQTLTVLELYEELQDFLNRNPEACDRLVYTHSDYGDHWHTQQLVPLRGEFKIVVPKQTAYSSSGLALQFNDDNEVVEPGEDFVDDPGNEAGVVLVNF